MRTISLALTLTILHAGCTSSEGAGSQAQIKTAVASVQLVEDCPDPPEAAPAAAAEVAPGAAMRGDSPYGSGPSHDCTQSTMQLSFENASERDGTVHITAVRLLDAAGSRELGRLGARKPSVWNPEGTYQRWDQVVPAGGTRKVAYRLGDPDWSAVQRAIGESEDIYARSFVIEVEVEVGGKTTTVRSPQFTRERVHVIVT
jgi:hypothetical protein